jgi:hypothetical protein
MNARNAYAPSNTRAMLLFKDDRWRLRHVQLWCLPIRMQTKSNGNERWVGVHPLLRHESLPSELFSGSDGEELLSF